MITKGIIEEITTPYSVKVRLPIFDRLQDSKNATPTSSLNDAIICSLPNSNNHLTLGDIVIVGFEDNDMSKPIILGHLYKETLSETKIDLDLRKLSTDSTTKLYEQTYIGNITPQEIKQLKGAKDNLQKQIDLLKDEIKELRSLLNV